MSKTSPARSAPGRRLNLSQASFCPSARQIVHDGINADDNIHFQASPSTQSGVLEGNRISDPIRKKKESILCIRWTCPPKFILNDEWLVATGEESEERKFQEQRESGVTDLIYTHPFAKRSLSKEDHSDEDHNIPIIPMTPIEDDETDPLHEDTPPPSGIENSSATALKLNGEKHPLGTLTGLKGLEADIGAAASAALTALMKCNEQGSLIDTNMLIKILNDPKMTELQRTSHTTSQDEAEVAISPPLLSNLKQEKFHVMQPGLDRQSVLHLHRLLSSAIKAKGSSIFSEIVGPKHGTHSDKLFKQVHKASAPMVVPISDPPCPPNLEEPSNHYTTSRPTKPGFFPTLHLSGSSADLNRHGSSQILPPKQVHKASAQMVVPVSDKPLPPNRDHNYNLTGSPGSSADMTKLQFNRDHEYYKSLIRQHGIERQEDVKEQRFNKVQNYISKTCRYFNSPKGCRLGLSCPYRHQDNNLAHRVPEAPIPKRVKLNGEF